MIQFGNNLTFSKWLFNTHLQKIVVNKKEYMDI